MTRADGATTDRTARFRQFWDRLEPVRRGVRDRFEVDTRALAAVRIVLALTIVADLAHRAQYLDLFYTDNGLYPIAAFEATYTRYNELSIHALSGDLWFQQLLFAIAGLVALSMLVGYRTRLSTFLSFVLLFSLQARNPAVLNGGDRLFRIVLALGVLAPLGERWSIDALRRGGARSRVRTLGTTALVIQPLAVFTANAMYKHPGEHWYSGDGLQIAMANDVMTIFLGNVIADIPPLLTVMNYAWLTLLAGSTVFLWLTVGRLRAFAALVYVGAFTGMALSMTVGFFPAILTAAVLPYLTTPFWDALARWLPGSIATLAPDRDTRGPLGKPPIEGRLLAGVRERGYESAVSSAITVARTTLAIVSLLAIVWIVTFTAIDVSVYEHPEQIDNDHLDVQRWNLYAPDPSESYTWQVAEAHLANGSTIDAVDGGAPSFDRPPNAATIYDSFRHRKYMRLVRKSGTGDSHSIFVDRYAAWACERAERISGSEVERVHVHEIDQPSPIDGEYEEPSVSFIELWDCENDWRRSL